jgi:hypothetical protein
MPAMRITLATRCTRAMRIFRGRIVFANPSRRERLAPGYTLKRAAAMNCAQRLAKITDKAMRSIENR